MSDRDRLGDPERFVAKPATIVERMTGAASGVLRPGDLAEEELGEVDWGQLMAYMFRRFGAPNCPSDDYKEICSWILTTPMEGLLLSVRITPSHTSLLFGYLVTHDLNRRLYDVEHARRTDFHHRFGAWCVATHGREPDSWGIYAPGRQTTVEERLAASRQFDEWRKEFEEANPEAEPRDDELVRAERAMRRAIRDLRRTVGVRDQDISALGIAEQDMRGVKRHDSAGYALPDYAYTSEMWRLYGAIHRAGGGRKGLARIADLVERSYPVPDDQKNAA